MSSVVGSVGAGHSAPVASIAGLTVFSALSLGVVNVSSHATDFTTYLSHGSECNTWAVCGTV